MPAERSTRQWQILTRRYAAQTADGLPRDPTRHMARYRRISTTLVVFFQEHAPGALVEEHTLNGTERLRLTAAGLAFYAREKVYQPDTEIPTPDV